MYKLRTCDEHETNATTGNINPGFVRHTARIVGCELRCRQSGCVVIMIVVKSYNNSRPTDGYSMVIVVLFACCYSVYSCIARCVFVSAEMLLVDTKAVVVSVIVVFDGITPCYFVCVASWCSNVVFAGCFSGRSYDLILTCTSSIK